MIDCHKCGQPGHVARDCQWESETSTRPTWCSECDRETRLVDHGTFMQRCHRCWAWPAKKTRFHQFLPQHKLCGGCQQIVYAWEKAPCGKHAPQRLDTAGHRPPQPELAPAIAAKARQAIAKENP